MPARAFCGWLTVVPAILRSFQAFDWSHFFPNPDTDRGVIRHFTCPNQWSRNKLTPLNFTEEIINSWGKDGPVKNEVDRNKWRRRVVFQKINLRQSQRPYQNNFDRQYNCGYSPFPGYWRVATSSEDRVGGFRKSSWARCSQKWGSNKKKGEARNEEEENEFFPWNFHWPWIIPYFLNIYFGRCRVRFFKTPCE